MGYCSEYVDAYIIIPRHCFTMQSEIVSEYDQEIPQSQTADKPMVLRGRAYNNHKTLGRQTKKNIQLSLPHQDDCRSLCAHLRIQQTYTGFTYICAVVHKVMLKLIRDNLFARELWNQQIRLTVKDIHMLKWVYYLLQGIKKQQQPVSTSKLSCKKLSSVCGRFLGFHVLCFKTFSVHNLFREKKNNNII